MENFQNVRIHWRVDQDNAVKVAKTISHLPKGSFKEF